MIMIGRMNVGNLDIKMLSNALPRFNVVTMPS